MIDTNTVIGPCFSGAPSRQPRMTSHAVGTLMRAALDAGCTKMTIVCGKTDACDAGAGMLEALGFQFLNRRGQRLHHSTPDRMSHLARISATEDLHPRLRNGMVSLLSGRCQKETDLAVY